METETISVVSKDAIIKKYGPWSAMAIALGNGEYTIEPPAADRRLKRIVQVAADLAGKPMNQLRVLDLACLEGHYAIEFAMRGAEAVGIELREANIVKARYAKQRLGLDKLELVQDDVRNLSVDKYGKFDLVICSGILYHLDAPDVFEFVRAISDVCTRLTIFDTFIALDALESQSFEGKEYWGVWYKEHDENASATQKQKDLWASVDNVRSFWLTRPSLINLLSELGFTSVYDVFFPPSHPEMRDRVTYVAIKGQPAAVVSSEPTDRLPTTRWPEQSRYTRNLANVKQSWLRLLVKRIVPQPAKNIIKKVLRTAGLMEPDSTPAFLKPEFSSVHDKDKSSDT